MLSSFLKLPCFITRWRSGPLVGGPRDLPVHGVNWAGLLHDTKPIPRYRLRDPVMSAWIVDADHTHVRLQLV